MKETEILQRVKERMGIDSLNDMQLQAINAWKTGGGDLVLYSPTGTGKTLAFALCLLQALKPPMKRLQAVVMAPRANWCCRRPRSCVCWQRTTR